MSKNIILCCDGTSNQFAANNTNVIKLYQALEHDPVQQATYYHPGLGTMEAVGALTSFTRKVTKILGLAVGYGLEDDVAHAYQFIMSAYAPGDRIFLFGFSRGAYTARAVASLLHMYGLIRPGNGDLIRYAIRMQAALSAEGVEKARADEVFKLAEGFRATFSSGPCETHFVGVWDTVSSVGWIANPVRLPFTADNPSIRIGRHAVSIDERRAFFRSNLWRPSSRGGPTDLKQVWFAGDHCDVGGGYSEAQSRLSDLALSWMAREASNAGLLINLDRLPHVHTEGARDAFIALPPAHEGIRGWWRLAEFVPKRHYDWSNERTSWRMNLFRRRTIPKGSLIHRSTFERGPQYRKRLPDSVIAVD